VHLLQCAIEEQPEEWTFWHTIAMIQADRKDPENAAIFFDEALRLNPTAKLLKSDYEDFKKKFPDAVASA
jgi:Tetratricopeptide repeat.